MLHSSYVINYRGYTVYTLQLPCQTCFCVFASTEEAQAYKSKWYAKTKIDVEIIPMPLYITEIVCPVID